MRIELRDTPFDPWGELAAHEQAQVGLTGQFGACATFVGSLRDLNLGDEVHGMTLEHYPGMTERELGRICTEAAGRWELLDQLVIHRVGAIEPGEPIVLVAAWSRHRREAFEACRALMEALKSRAPFWKKEHLADGERWVDGNTAGY